MVSLELQSGINPGKEIESASPPLISCLLHPGDLHPLLQNTTIVLKFGGFISLEIQLRLSCSNSRPTSIRLEPASSSGLLLPLLTGGRRHRGSRGNLLRRLAFQQRVRSVIRLSPSCPAGPGARLGFYKYQQEKDTRPSTCSLTVTSIF